MIWNKQPIADKDGDRDELRADQLIADLDGYYEELDEDQSACIVGGIVGGVEARPNSHPWIVSLGLGYWSLD